MSHWYIIGALSKGVSVEEDYIYILKLSNFDLMRTHTTGLEFWKQLLIRKRTLWPNHVFKFRNLLLLINFHESLENKSSTSDSNLLNPNQKTRGIMKGWMFVVILPKLQCFLRQATKKTLPFCQHNNKCLVLCILTGF